MKLVLACAVAATLLSVVSSVRAGADTSGSMPAAAPQVVLQSVINGNVETYNLQAAAAKRPVVLYFFPKAFTGGCTIEAKTFAAWLSGFNEYGYDVVGASTDDVQTLASFQKAENAGQRFVSDPDGAIAKAFGVAQQYQGKTYAGRVTFVIGTDGTILYRVADDVPETNVSSVYDWVKAHPATKTGS
jgi:thioredoxin-dependent peroxiredoxin